VDFTVRTYELLLKALKGHYSGFYGFAEIVSGEFLTYVVLRHDVDRKPENALVLARAEAAAGIRASYHFRIGSNLNQDGIISEVAGLGHEIAYHYEDLSSVYGRSALNAGPPNEEVAGIAFERFRTNLEDLRRLADVNVISMHGSPLSAVDNRQLWKYYDYRASGIVCEPYFDIDVSKVLYLTDTGRRWDGDRSNIRDRGFSADVNVINRQYRDWKACPVPGSMMNMSEEGLFLRSRFRIRHTSGLIALAEKGSLPEKLIINTHPQRWTDSAMPWFTEYLTQNIKNQFKRMI
jgi:hypothetical protein